MAELDTIYIILGAQAVAMLVTTATYSYLRLRKEERKVKASEAAAASSNASFQAMTVYHAKRLEIEEEKLEIARNGTRVWGEAGTGKSDRIKRASLGLAAPIELEGDAARRFMDSMERTLPEGTYRALTPSGKVVLVTPPKPGPISIPMNDEEFYARIKRIREMP